MVAKVNSLYPFDRAFFGKTLAKWNFVTRHRGESTQARPLKMNSADDFCKHYDLFSNKVVQTKTAKRYDLKPVQEANKVMNKVV